MANFFNELGKKLSDVGSTAMQKTKEFSDITKLNSAISEEERNQGNLYTQLGKIYYDQDAPEDIYKDTVEALKSSMAKVTELKEQLKAIKKVRTCESCGTEIANDAVFCPKCGAKLPEVLPPQPEEKNDANKCQNCGKELEEGAQFCPDCGTEVTKEETVEACDTHQAEACEVCGAGQADADATKEASDSEEQ